jgi:regulator of protease activity HflC (stomatin/prohibitin superfamily)
MIELTLVTLALLFVIFVVKPGRTPPLANPMVINRLGQYHITLAPQLNLAQPLIEDIAKQLGNPAELAANSSTLCFEVRDAEVKAHGQDFYLLAVTQRNGMLYFQAAASQAGEAQIRKNELLAFADKTLSNIPIAGDVNEKLNEHIISAAHKVAQQHGGSIANL